MMANIVSMQIVVVLCILNVSESAISDTARWAREVRKNKQLIEMMELQDYSTKMRSWVQETSRPRNAARNTWSFRLLGFND